MEIEPEANSTIRYSAAKESEQTNDRCNISFTCHDRALTSTSSSNNTNLLPTFYMYCHALENRWKSGSVFQRDILEFNLPPIWPWRRRLLRRNFVGSLLLDVVCIVNDPLNRVHVVPDFSESTNHPSEPTHFSKFAEKVKQRSYSQLLHIQDVG